MESAHRRRGAQGSIETPESEQEALKQRVEQLEGENTLLKERIKHLESQLGIDQLTGTSNRGVFENELERSLKIIRGETEEHRSTAEHHKEVSLIFVDLDHFKQINDTYGHPAGDEVLRKVSALLMDSVRETDIVARVGGEEFVVLMRGADESVAARDAEDFRMKISQMEFENYPDLQVTASFGVSSSESSQLAKDLYEKADKALYEAKRSGRNRVIVAGKI